MKVIYENDRYIVEVHPVAPMPYWIIDKTVVNPLHPVDCFYDDERAVEWADWYASRTEKQI